MPLSLWCCSHACPAGHAGATLCLDLSPNGSLLATAGVDAQGRQELVCWDVSACCAPEAAGGGRAVELARHVSDYNIQAVKCVPYDPTTLVTCGKNSIRTYRRVCSAPAFRLLLCMLHACWLQGSSSRAWSSLRVCCGGVWCRLKGGQLRGMSVADGRRASAASALQQRHQRQRWRHRGGGVHMPGV